MWIILSLLACLVLAGLVRKFGSHTLLNGYMSKEQADDVFPGWRKERENESLKPDEEKAEILSEKCNSDTQKH